MNINKKDMEALASALAQYKRKNGVQDLNVSRSPNVNCWGCGWSCVGSCVGSCLISCVGSCVSCMAACNGSCRFTCWGGCL